MFCLATTLAATPWFLPVNGVWCRDTLVANATNAVNAVVVVVVEYSSRLWPNIPDAGGALLVVVLNRKTRGAAVCMQLISRRVALA